MQLDAIQRSQKLLEARLQDLHKECSMNEVSRSGDEKHFRLILTEMQKALGSVVSSMVSTQDGIRTMATVLTEVCNAVNTNAGNEQRSAASTSAAAGNSATGKLITVMMITGAHWRPRGLDGYCKTKLSYHLETGCQQCISL